MLYCRKIYDEDAFSHVWVQYSISDSEESGKVLLNVCKKNLTLNENYYKTNKTFQNTYILSIIDFLFLCKNPVYIYTFIM